MCIYIHDFSFLLFMFFFSVSFSCFWLLLYSHFFLFDLHLSLLPSFMLPTGLCFVFLTYLSKKESRMLVMSRFFLGSEVKASVNSYLEFLSVILEKVRNRNILSSRKKKLFLVVHSDIHSYFISDQY